MPLDGRRAALSSSDELSERGGVLPGASSILGAPPPEPVRGCSSLGASLASVAPAPALQAPCLAPASVPSPAPRPPPPRSPTPGRALPALGVPHREQAGPAWPEVTTRPLPTHDNPTCLAREEAAQTERDRWKGVHPEQPQR